MSEGIDSSLVRKALATALGGRYSHVPPDRAIPGLTAAEAGLAPGPGQASAQRVLHHMVYWQDLILQAAQGHKPQWPAGPVDWQEEMPPWAELVARFAAGLAAAQELAAGADLAVALPHWGPESNVLHGLTVLATHNSYHLGQLLAARRATGCWPTPDSRA